MCKSIKRTYQSTALIDTRVKEFFSFYPNRHEIGKSLCFCVYCQFFSHSKVNTPNTVYRFTFSAHSKWFFIRNRGSKQQSEPHSLNVRSRLTQYKMYEPLKNTRHRTKRALSMQPHTPNVCDIRLRYAQAQCTIHTAFPNGRSICH